MGERMPRCPEVSSEREINAAAELPPGVCAQAIGDAVDTLSYIEAREILVVNGLGAVADRLGDFEDVYHECGVHECPSFINLSNQGGEIMMQSYGTGQDGCIRDSA